MPLLESSYIPTFPFENNHINTFYKTAFYKKKIKYNRVRIDTPDLDFIDLDFSVCGSNTLIIAMHGLEGSSESNYMVSAIKYLNSYNLDCVAVNFRGCSGFDNRQIYTYHSGKSDDIKTIINYILQEFKYKRIILLGYSMGGNIVLKYLGETAIIPSRIKGAIAFSVPCDLEGSSKALANPNNKLYLRRFLKTLRKKTLKKINKYPHCSLDRSSVQTATNFEDFDNAVTAPLFGFDKAKDYWEKCSSKQFIPTINIPTLLVNALDDTFLSASCYPFEEAKKHSCFYLETPDHGGHVGFNNSVFSNDQRWSNHRIIDFINSVI